VERSSTKLQPYRNAKRLNVIRYIFVLLISFLYFSKSLALIEVDITRGNLDPLPIAVSPLHVDIKSEGYKDLKIKNLGG